MAGGTKAVALRNWPRWLWAIIIVLVNIIGPIAYFLIGRREE